MGGLQRGPPLCPPGGLCWPSWPAGQAVLGASPTPARKGPTERQEAPPHTHTQLRVAAPPSGLHKASCLPLGNGAGSIRVAEAAEVNTGAEAGEGGVTGQPSHKGSRMPPTFPKVPRGPDRQGPPLIRAWGASAAEDGAPSASGTRPASQGRSWQGPLVELGPQGSLHARCLGGRAQRSPPTPSLARSSDLGGL